ncbi:MAG: hypothetical protein IPN76_20465 [Saprospiraceae bacterium]|nr:hypothetical protein [Saprospiraceae bacterium]
MEQIGTKICSPIFKINKRNEILQDSVQKAEEAKAKKSKKNNNHVIIPKTKAPETPKQINKYYFEDGIHEEETFVDNKTSLSFYVATFGTNHNSQSAVGVLKVGNVEIEKFELKASKSSFYEYFFEGTLFQFRMNRLHFSNMGFSVNEWYPE